MEKQKSMKIEKWTTKDVVKCVAVYVSNLIILAALFLMTIYLNGLGGFTESIEDYFTDATTSIHFFVLLSITIAVMAVYFLLEDRDFMRNPVNSEMLFLIIEISFITGYICGRYLSIYLRPLALTALLTLFLTNRKSAIFMNSLYCILLFIMDVFASTETSLNQYSALIIGFSSGLVAIFVMDKVYSRMRLLLRSLIISVPMVFSVTMSLFQNEVRSGGNIAASLVSGVFSGPVAAALFILLLPFFESAFRKVSCFKLAELTDHRSKLIRRMIKEAPGTFNHAIVVSNIAEACATAIGEDALLARTCAYYHDIGKLRRPEFFGENQVDGQNLHDDLTPELSTNIIKAHVTDGYNLVMKHGLPKEIADVCLEHHGTMPIWFFYAKAKKFTDGEVNINEYCYEGPKPRTKIAAIIMIADGCEAAARTLKDRSRDNVQKVVRKIVSERMGLGQFDECEITIKELNIIIHTVVNNFSGIYHSRVDYPKVSLEGLDKDEG